MLMICRERVQQEMGVEEGKGERKKRKRKGEEKWGSVRDILQIIVISLPRYVTITIKTRLLTNSRERKQTPPPASAILQW
jgi:hypothetical protein